MGRITLYCPSTHKTINNFVITTYQKPEQVLQGVRLALDIKYAALYTTAAKHISDPQTLQEDERVLVAAREDEVMLPDAAYSYVMYNGEEGDDVDCDVEGFGEEWANLTDNEKCLHIESLSVTKPDTRNKMRITREYAAVKEEFTAIGKLEIVVTPVGTAAEGKDGDEMPKTPHETTIQARWNTSLDAFLPSSMKPVTSGKYTTPSHASALPNATLAALAIFSSCTHGQARLAREVLVEAIALRTEEDQGEDRGPVVRVEDVMNAVEMIYERAGVIPVKLTKGKGGKTRKRAKGKGRKSDGSSGSGA